MKETGSITKSELLNLVNSRFSTEIADIRVAQQAIDESKVDTLEYTSATLSLETAKATFQEALFAGSKSSSGSKSSGISETMRSFSAEGETALDVCRQLCNTVVFGFNEPNKAQVEGQEAQTGKAPSSELEK